MIKHHDVAQGSEAWHKLRTGKYTGSNAHRLLKYGTIDYSLNDDDSSFSGNYWTKRGHILEDEAIELYEKIKHTTVNRVGFVTNNRFDSCGYSPDGLTENALIEVKCFSEKRHLELYNGNIPLEVLAQIYFGMMICEKKTAHLLIYNPTLDPKLAFKIIEVKFKQAIVSNFKRILKESYV